MRLPLAERMSNLLHGAGSLVGIPLLIVIVSIDVLLRYGFNAPLLWGGEISALLLLLVFFASLPHCTNHGGHIRMELFYERMGPRRRSLADLLSALCGLIFSAFLSYQAFHSTLEAVTYEERAEMIDVPYWPFTLFMCLGGLFLSLLFVTRVAEDFRRLVKGPPAEGEG
jgi:TRAP-type C4-dicarboxylate transport system permease small subunit